MDDDHGNVVLGGREGMGDNRMGSCSVATGGLSGSYGLGGGGWNIDSHLCRSKFLGIEEEDM